MGIKSLFANIVGKVENTSAFRRLEAEQITLKPHSKLWFLGKAMMLLGAFILVGVVVHEVDRGNPRVSRITSLVSPYVTIGETDVVSRMSFNAEQSRAKDCEGKLANLMAPPPDPPGGFSTTVAPVSDQATFEAEHPSADLPPLKTPIAELPKLPAKPAAAPPAKKHFAPKCIGWCAIGKVVGAN